ncbi:hypothetical protein HELRODRAFT_194677 [Helobdella robusta]|uniref:NAD(+) ADP-ribosyltransferase n=1 Tax=Helobdella robusta TaxID=6412 RepID=T1FWB0_HELRO|nr:hypothetical protein HELRODRAFT_194677 [Helobdella robusta]ESN90185.1 hypothetical protein HELRODRAFT_194677 [Helobdella robusta]
MNSKFEVLRQSALGYYECVLDLLEEFDISKHFLAKYDSVQIRMKKDEKSESTEKNQQVQFELRWEWENKKGRKVSEWKIFPENGQQIFSKLFKIGHSVAAFGLDGQLYDLKFDDLLMKNQKSKFEKLIRTAVINKDKNIKYEIYTTPIDQAFLWQYETEGKCCQYFKPTDCLILESAYNRKGNTDTTTTTTTTNITTSTTTAAATTTTNNNYKNNDDDSIDLKDEDEVVIVKVKGNDYEVSLKSMRAVDKTDKNISYRVQRISSDATKLKSDEGFIIKTDDDKMSNGNLKTDDDNDSGNKENGDADDDDVNGGGDDDDTKTNRPAKKSKRVKPSKTAAVTSDPIPSTSTDTNNTVANNDNKRKKAGSKVTAKATSIKDEVIKVKADVTKVKGGVTDGGGGEDKKESKQMKTIVIKGRAPVDPECKEMVTQAHVYDDGNDVYDVMLNQTNINNNNNKFYIIQLLESDNSKTYHVWTRWGRVGARGQTALMPFAENFHSAYLCFCKKFQDKTKNQWTERDSFEKVAGKYDIVHIDYKTKEPKPKIKKEIEAAPKVPESKLHPKLQDLIRLIYDIKEMESTVMEMQYDAKKAPLGQLTERQISNGFSTLKVIERLISCNSLGSSLVEACNTFYTQIPHCFGMRRPPLINTTDHLLREMKLLEVSLWS